MKTVIAKSIERIHLANLINFGIIPLIFENPDDYDKISKNDKIVLKNITNAVLKSDSFLIENITQNSEFKVKLNFDNREREILLAGGLLNYIAKNNAEEN